MFLEILMFSASAVSIVSYLPQLLLIWKNKSSANISAFSWLMYIWVTLCYLIYSFSTSTLMFKLGSAFEFSISVFIFVSVIKFKPKRSREVQEEVQN